MDISKLFDNILDLPGIEGACLFDAQGRLLVNRMPAFFSPEIFADAQRRITALYETMDENFLPCDDYVLRFSERSLLLRRTGQVVLMILAGEKANLSSTRMVTNMTLKHLTADALATLTPIAAPAPTPIVSVTPVPAAPATPAATAPATPAPVAAATPPTRTRVYRGQIY